MEDITIDVIADFISKHRVLDARGEPFWGFVKYQFEDGCLGILKEGGAGSNYVFEQTKKIEARTKKPKGGNNENRRRAGVNQIFG